MASENNATIHDTKIYKVSESIQQHMEELEPILQTAIKVGATFDISGSALLQNTIQANGHTWTQKHKGPCKENILTRTYLPSPMNKTSLDHIMGQMSRPRIHKRIRRG